MRKSQGFVQGKHLCSLFWCRSSNSIGQNLKQKKEHTLCKYDVNKHFITFCIQSAACTLMISIEETLSYRKTCVTGFVTMTCFNPAFSVPKKKKPSLLTLMLLILSWRKPVSVVQSLSLLHYVVLWNGWNTDIKKTHPVPSWSRCRFLGCVSSRRCKPPEAFSESLKVSLEVSPDRRRSQDHTPRLYFFFK